MRILPPLALLLVLATPALAGSSGEGDDPPAAGADYPGSMREARRAESKKRWREALAAYRRALEAKPGDFSATKAVEKIEKKLGGLPPGFETRFALPSADEDRLGNPVSVRSGRLADPETGFAYEIWLKAEESGCGQPVPFLLAPPGRFTMGSPNSEGQRYPNEGPPHAVAIQKPFYIAKYEVTQGWWRAVMGTNPSRFPDFGDDHPVETVTWGECKTFCEKTDLALPTEAQWEYACRAGTETPFHFGRTATAEQVNYHGDYPYGGAPAGMNRQSTVRVGSLPPSPWGLYEMHGNVWEWCEDVYSGDFYASPEAAGPDPVCTGGGTLRVLRGGAWVGYATYCRSASRDGQEPSLRAGHIGFRPVKGVD